MSNPQLSRPNTREFRYIIVGAGTAGCLLAYWLSRHQSGSIALIEAGPEFDGVRSVVPQLYPHLFGSPVDWGYQTTPQPGLSGRRIGWPRGKMVGGSGAMNALIHLQAAQADFQRWGWPADEVASQLSVLNEIVPQHPLLSPHPWSLSFLESARASGLKTLPVWGQSELDTCGHFPLAAEQGRRWHSGQLARREAQNHSIALMTKYRVTQLCFDHSRVEGVTIAGGPHGNQTLYAEDAVILCAGAIGTPELLLRSGVGNADELRQAGRSCRHELPWVGKNLQDHLVYPLVFRTRTAAGLQRRHTREQRESYRATGCGPLASNIAEAGAFFDVTEPSRSAHAAPQFQLHFTPTHYLKFPKTPTSDCFLSLGVTALHPSSRGTLKLLPAAAQAQPQLAIDPQYLTEPSDRGRFLDAIRWTRELAARPGLQEIVAEELLPGSKRTSEPSLLKSLSTFAQSIYHPVGTCRMDSGEGKGAEQAVVDDQFRVHGLAGLRIADASVLPDLPSSNTNAVTLLVALLAAKQLLDS